jgi:hypothetical protein
VSAVATRGRVYAPAPIAPGPLLLGYGILAVASTARSSEQLLTKASEAPVAYGLPAVSAVIYLVAWQALRLAPRHARAAAVARAACSVELVGVLLVGLASLVLPSAFAHPTVWSGFGVGYAFAPLVLPAAALWWLPRGGPALTAAGADASSPPDRSGRAA